MQNVEFLTTHGFLNMCLFKSEVNVLSYGRAAMFKNYDLNGHYVTMRHAQKRWLMQNRKRRLSF